RMFGYGGPSSQPSLNPYGSSGSPGYGADFSGRARGLSSSTVAPPPTDNYYGPGYIPKHQTMGVRDLLDSMRAITMGTQSSGGNGTSGGNPTGSGSSSGGGGIMGMLGGMLKGGGGNWSGGGGLSNILAGAISGRSGT